MILKTFEISEDSVQDIVVHALKRTMKVHGNGRDPDSPELVAACKKLIEYFGPPPKP